MSEPAKEPTSPVSKSDDDSSPSVEFLDPLSEDSSDDARPKSPSHPPRTNAAVALDLWPCLLAALARKKTPASVDAWLDLILTLDGRDKVTKVLQYTARLLAWYYSSVTASAMPYKSLQQSLTKSRKAYRLGRSFIELRRLQLAQTKTSARPPPDSAATSSSFPYGSLAVMDSLFDSIALWVRHLGLAGFWALDNTAFLVASGFWWNHDRLDDYRQTETPPRRAILQSRASRWANRSYFASAVAGFWINLRALRQFRRQVQTEQPSNDDKAERERLQAKYFGLCLALLKSVCDILVFSNNAGVDLWKRYYGHKLHELVHCLGGLTSASVVLYKNFPAATVGKHVSSP